MTRGNRKRLLFNPLKTLFHFCPRDAETFNLVTYLERKNFDRWGPAGPLSLVWPPKTVNRRRRWKIKNLQTAIMVSANKFVFLESFPHCL
jgi:hypothetical protein